MSDGVEWALHCCTVLAVVPAEGPGLTAGRLAEFHGVPAAYLAKQLQALTRAGILEAAPGRGGGYRLARAAGAITMLDVVDAVEGSERVFHCSEIRQRGPAAVARREYRLPCAVARAMYDAEAAYRASLRTTTIADLISRVAVDASPVALARAAAWFQEVLP